MHKVIFLLIWILFPPQDLQDKASPVITSHPYATVEACQAAGAKLTTESEALATNKEISDFFGACVEVDSDAAEAIISKDKEGSV